MAQEPAGEAEVLRVAIQGGGCGGFEYALGFDRGATGEDAEVEFHGVRSSSIPASAQYLKGATIDFVERSRSPGSRSTTRTPPARAAAATASRSPRRGRRRSHEHVQRSCSASSRRLLALSAACASRSSAPARPASTPPRRCSRRGAQVDLIERLPTPWGLVRLGVAPDHPEIKAVSRVFEKTAAEPGFRFFGNVDVGKTISPAELAALYDAVVYTVGAQTDRRLGHPRRGPARLVARHRVRRLVQRPPRLPGARVRPLAASARSWSGTATSRSTSPGCSR